MKRFTEALAHQAVLASVVALALLLWAGALALWGIATASLTFESWESTTGSGGAVHNQVSYQPGWSVDTWTMKQSHTGKLGLESGFDRVAIQVDHSVEPAQARYFQFDSTSGKELEYRTSCALCHANGPRVLRPAPQTSVEGAGVLSRWVMLLMNLRIKLYGTVQNVVTPLGGRSRSVPLNWGGAAYDEELQHERCVACHGSSGLASRSPLQKRHFMPISFMLKNELMPLGFHGALSESEKQEILSWLRSPFLPKQGKFN